MAAALGVYWAALCVGTHLPGGLVGTPLVSDKTLHFFAYTGLSFLIAMLLPLLGRTAGNRVPDTDASGRCAESTRQGVTGLLLSATRLGVRGWRVDWTALFVSVGYGAIDELGQIPIPGRTADVVDWLADAAGAVAGVVCYRLMTGAMTLRPFSPSGQKKPSPP